MLIPDFAFIDNSRLLSPGMVPEGLVCVDNSMLPDAAITTILMHNPNIVQGSILATLYDNVSDFGQYIAYGNKGKGLKRTASTTALCTIGQKAYLTTIENWPTVGSNTRDWSFILHCNLSDLSATSCPILDWAVTQCILYAKDSALSGWGFKESGYTISSGITLSENKDYVLVFVKRNQLYNFYCIEGIAEDVDDSGSFGTLVSYEPSREIEFGRTGGRTAVITPGIYYSYTAINRALTSSEAMALVHDPYMFLKVSGT